MGDIERIVRTVSENGFGCESKTGVGSFQVSDQKKNHCGISGTSLLQALFMLYVSSSLNDILYSLGIVFESSSIFK